MKRHEAKPELSLPFKKNTLILLQKGFKPFSYFLLTQGTLSSNFDDIIIYDAIDLM